MESRVDVEKLQVGDVVWWYDIATDEFVRGRIALLSSGWAVMERDVPGSKDLPYGTTPANSLFSKDPAPMMVGSRVSNIPEKGKPPEFGDVIAIDGEKVWVRWASFGGSDVRDDVAERDSLERVS